MAASVCEALDHVVLTCRSIPATVEFNTKQLAEARSIRSPKDPSVER